MVSSQKMHQRSSQAESLVYTNFLDICQLIQHHADLGFFEMEVFVDKKNAEKYARKLRSKKYYCAVFHFESLKNESRLYVSWISNF